MTWLLLDSKINILGNTEQKAQYIENINIKVTENNTNNIINHIPVNHTLCYDNKISIYDFQGIAININIPQEQQFFTRLVYVDTVSLWAKPSKTTVGLLAKGRVGDLRISNFECMYAQMGIRNEVSMLVDNVHIWTGETGQDVNDWWSNTIGIKNVGTAHLIGSNIYIDSSLIAIENGTTAITKINGLYYWEDNSMQGSNRDDSTLVYTTSDYASNNVSIENAIIYTGSRMKYITCPITNAKIIVNNIDRMKYILNNSNMKVNDNYYSLDFSDEYSETDVTYALIGLVSIRGNGVARLYFALDGGQDLDLTVVRHWNGSLILKGEYTAISHNYFYKLDNGLLYIYAQKGVRNNFPVSGEIRSKSRYVYPVNLNDFVLYGNTELRIPTLTSTEGLTQLQITQR